MRYCVSVCNQIACHLHISVFKIKPCSLLSSAPHWGHADHYWLCPLLLVALIFSSLCFIRRAEEDVTYVLLPTECQDKEYIKILEYYCHCFCFSPVQNWICTSFIFSPVMGILLWQTHQYTEYFRRVQVLLGMFKERNFKLLTVYEQEMYRNRINIFTFHDYDFCNVCITSPFCYCKYLQITVL